MIRVLVADDHNLFRVGISRILADTDGMDVIAQAVSGEEAINAYQEHSPDITLMDIRMPGIGGLEATRQICQINPCAKIIAVTACIGQPYPARLIKSGAFGYITKNSSITEVVTAIHNVFSGKKYISPEVAQQMALTAINPDGVSPFSLLSRREMQIALMIVNCEKVQGISDKLSLNPKTVNSYRYRMFEKLNINSDVELTHLAIRHDLIDTAS